MRVVSTDSCDGFTFGKPYNVVDSDESILPDYVDYYRVINDRGDEVWCLKNKFIKEFILERLGINYTK